MFDTLLDEQTILGLALGAAVSGLPADPRDPVPRLRAQRHRSAARRGGDALVLLAAPLPQRDGGADRRLRLPEGVRRPLPQRQRASAVLRDLPGVVVASPATGADAAAMLRTCAAAATVDGTVSVFLEPIALYHTRDLHAPGDEAAGSPRPDDEHVPIGEARLARDGDDVLVVSWANGLYLSLRVAERLAREGIGCRVLDLRWLVPLPVAAIVAHARAVGRVVVVDETRHTGGVGEAVVTALVEAGFTGPIRRVAAADSFIPLGDAATLVLVSENDVVDAVATSCADPPSRVIWSPWFSISGCPAASVGPESGLAAGDVTSAGS